MWCGLKWIWLEMQTVLLALCKWLFRSQEYFYKGLSGRSFWTKTCTEVGLRSNWKFKKKFGKDLIKDLYICAKSLNKI